MIITLKNGNVETDIETVGARINALRVNGVDIVLGFDSVEDYVKSCSCAGATIGRVANRIADGKFTLNGNCSLVFRVESKYMGLPRRLCQLWER